MPGMSFFVRLAICSVSYTLGSLVSLLVLPHLVVETIKKGPRAVFCAKKRSAPPACMQDPSLGVHGYAYLENLRLHYVSNGAEDKPLMLLVHGFPEFWYSWRYQLKEFKDKYRVVAVDQRGYSDSDKPSGVSSYTLSTLVSDLRQLVEALGYKKCVLVGHDWGGLVAWSFAQTCPEMVEKFIVMNAPSANVFLKRICTSFSQFKKSWYISFFQVPFLPELFLRLSDMASLSSMPASICSGLMTEEDVEAYKFTFQRSGFTNPMNYYRALLRYPDFVLNRLSKPECRVQCPTLIIWGCKDKALDTELASLCAKNVSGEVTIKYIEDCSHWPHMDQPEIVNKYMREFLQSAGVKSEL